MLSRLFGPAACLAASLGSAAAAEAPLGRPAPAVNLTSPEGRRISLSKLRGKVVLLDFWGPN